MENRTSKQKVDVMTFSFWGNQLTPRKRIWHRFQSKIALSRRFGKFPKHIFTRIRRRKETFTKLKMNFLVEFPEIVLFQSGVFNVQFAK